MAVGGGGGGGGDCALPQRLPETPLRTATSIAPPMSTSSLILEAMLGSASSAAAKLVSGPVITRVIGSSALAKVSLSRSWPVSFDSGVLIESPAFSTGIQSTLNASQRHSFGNGLRPSSVPAATGTCS